MTSSDRVGVSVQTVVRRVSWPSGSTSTPRAVAGVPSGQVAETPEEARAAAEDFTEDGETVFLQGDVPRAAVGKNDDGIDLGERGRILGPAIEGHFGADPLDGCEAFLKQQDARIMFVLPGPVAGWSGDEQDFFIGGEQGGGSQISEQREQQGGGQARPE